MEYKEWIIKFLEMIEDDDVIFFKPDIHIDEKAYRKKKSYIKGNASTGYLVLA